MPMALEPPPTQADHQIGQAAFALQHLGAGFVADHGLEIAHHRRDRDAAPPPNR